MKPRVQAASARALLLCVVGRLLALLVRAAVLGGARAQPQPQQRHTRQRPWRRNGRQALPWRHCVNV
jgi:hypothetical protein